jgi:HIV Tat-specific factor 1
METDNKDSEYGSEDTPDVPIAKTEDTKPNNAEGEEADKELKELGPNYSRDPENNSLVYTDPDSKKQYILNPSKTDWILKTESDNVENQYDFDGTTYCHTNSDGVRYKWELDSNQWVKDGPKNKIDSRITNKNDLSQIVEEDTESEEDENTTDDDRKRRQYRKRKAAPDWGKQGIYTTDSETGAQLYKESGDAGMTYEWDASKKAWFPRINEDFMAHYQMNYGFTPDGEYQPTRPEEPSEETVENKKAKLDEKAPPKKPQWFEEENEKSTKVYVTGLPTSDDYNEEKFVLLMSKVIIIINRKYS